MTGVRQLCWLAPDSPPDAFPDARTALKHPNGLLAAGGDLSPARLLAAYRRGIFPWFNAGEPVLWWCPDPRAVIVPRELHCSRSLRRTLRSGRFQLSIDQAFPRLIRLCADTRAASGTWLGEDMITAYCELHAQGHAHSVEVWHQGELVGGLYGIAIGGIFFGESMVSLQPDASKTALVELAQIAGERHIGLIDCQVPNDHLMRLGARLMPRAQFLRALSRHLATPPLQRLVPEPPHPGRANARADA